VVTGAAVSSGGGSPLPLGAIIGLAVGGAAALLVLVIGAVLLYKKRRARKEPALVSTSAKKNALPDFDEQSASELESAVHDLM
jgi:hypothetical protein